MNSCHPYLESIFEISKKYLNSTLSQNQYNHLVSRCLIELAGLEKRETIEGYVRIFYEVVKHNYQQEYVRVDPILKEFLQNNNHQVKVLWGDCLDFMKTMDSESVHLMVTSPPYYNARDYSQWKNIDNYLSDMEAIIREAYRVLDNHRVFVFNVGDIFGNDNRVATSTWGKRRIPLGAYFTNIFERVGFTFVDDFIWDKGEVQTQRHKSGGNPYPLYQYPVNCYEHIFVFYKHRLDKTRYPCPICGCLKVNGNAYSSIGVKSWECKNLKCFERSPANRGKRFSARTQLMNDLKTDENIINETVLEEWRRDIVKIPPVIKVNSKGKNILGHTAPFPSAIPNFAIQVFSGCNEIVLDPFAGSFTTPIEAVKLNRRGVGIELRQDLFRTPIINNIQKHLGVDSYSEFGAENDEWRKQTIETKESLAYTVK